MSLLESAHASEIEGQRRSRRRFPKLPRGRLLAVVAIALLGMGCKYFKSITIPVSDTQAPGSVVSVYDVVGGDYEAVNFTPGLRFVVTDPAKVYHAVGAAYDQGGAKSVFMRGSWAYKCSEGKPTLSTYVVKKEPDQFKEQPDRSPGQSASNGVWNSYMVQFGSAPGNCPGGNVDQVSIEFRWTVISTDYHGNTSSNIGTMVYYPPPVTLGGGAGF